MLTSLISKKVFFGQSCSTMEERNKFPSSCGALLLHRWVTGQDSTVDIIGVHFMYTQSKVIFGAGIVAIGTISAAVGASPLNFINSNLREDLSLWGNVLQAGGNALQADGQRDIFRKIGKEVQSIGNSTVITGYVLDLNEETEKKLFITGNWIQALGGLINV
jgi:hypothetical protein